MCGIVGYVGQRQATPILVDGLRKLEYRGYDSAGVAVWDGQQSKVVRCEGKLRNLEERLVNDGCPGQVGIGHTRWATHGKPSDQNAHPHRVGGVSVVHNGIIENHMELRQALKSRGVNFTSDTDTEIVAHLVAEKVSSMELKQAVRATLTELRGAYALAVISDHEPDVLVAAKSASPMVIGFGEGEYFVASDITAILEQTRDVVVVDEDELVVLSREGVTFFSPSGASLQRTPKRINWSAAQAEKGGYRHFMLKEIFEQPRAIADTLAGRINLSSGEILLDDTAIDATKVQRIVIVACGTSFYAGLVAKSLIESIARIPTIVELGSEFRYKNPVVLPNDLVIAVSQSGETADTMAAVREAKSKGAQVLAIANVLDSAIPRLADWALYTHAGPEIGVASTKAFTTQIALLTLVAIKFGQARGEIEQSRAEELLHGLAEMPGNLAMIFEQVDVIKAIAKKYHDSIGFFFLGRGAQYPIALEGALKLKEISYIHAEGYAAGEMKHGPLALIDEYLPTVVIAPKDRLYEKVMSNLTAVQARSGKIIAIATQGDPDIVNVAEDVIYMPKAPPELVPIFSVVPLQLLAYHVADLKGTDIDQPRNLAKSVTVE